MLKCYMLRWLSCRRKFNKRWENKPQKASISRGMYFYYQYYLQGCIATTSISCGMYCYYQYYLQGCIATTSITCRAVLPGEDVLAVLTTLANTGKQTLGQN